MNDISSDDIFLLKQRLAEQEALIHALQEKLSNREREIDHLQAQLDKLRRMNFGSRSEKVSRRIAQMEADLNRLQKESDTLTGRVYDPAVQRPLRQTRTRKPFPESLPRDEKRLLPAAPCCPNCGRSLTMNLRSDDRFVQDEGWYRAAQRYEDFLRRHRRGKVLYLELGVGYNTPVIIKYPFWQLTAKNPDAVYACINLGQAECPGEIGRRAVCIDGDVGAALAELLALNRGGSTEPLAHPRRKLG